MSFDEATKQGTDTKGRKYRTYKGRRTTELRTVLLRRVVKKDGTATAMWREWMDGDGTTFLLVGSGDIVELKVLYVGADKEPQ